MQESSRSPSLPSQPSLKQRIRIRVVFALALLMLVGGVIVLVRRTQQSFLEEVAVELPTQTPQVFGVRPIREVIGEAAPDFDLNALNATASRVRLFGLRGTPVVLLFFASWSDASLEGLKILDALRPEFTENGIAVFALSTLEPKDAAARIQERLGLRVQLLVDEDGAVGEAYGISTLPSLFFIARDGILKDGLFGIVSAEDIRAKALALLAL